MDSQNLSREEALNFAKNILQIENVETKLESNKLSLLNEIIRAQHRYVPYQNYSLLGTDVDKRIHPSEEKCINDNLSQTGGLCVNLQAFFAKFLQALGYKSHLVFGEIPFAKVRNNHLVIIVSQVEELHDRFYVDVGCSWPTFCAIPLHDITEEESHTYQFSFLDVRLSKKGDSYVRSHKKKSLEGEGQGEEMWLEILFFQPDSPKAFTEFDESMNAVFTNEFISEFLQNIYATLYPPGFGITVKNLTIRIWNEETKSIEQMDFDSIEDASEKIAELFPMLPLEVIQKGYIGWQSWEKRNIGKQKIKSFEHM